MILINFFKKIYLKYIMMLFYNNYKYYNRFKFNFFFFSPLLSVSEFKYKRILPNSGDLVIIKFFNRYTGIKLSFFKMHLFFGMCISRKNKNVTSYFITRNIYRRNAFELFIYIYSPLINHLKYFSNKRKFFSKACLFFLRSKKISYTKIIL